MHEVVRGGGTLDGLGLFGSRKITGEWGQLAGPNQGYFVEI